MEIEQKGGVYHLSGRIDEFASFDSLLDATPPLRLNLGRVTSINSIGVRKFLAFTLAWSPRKFEFAECTPEFIANVNVIPQMLGSPSDETQVKSFYVPYSCQSCKRVQNTLFVREHIKFNDRDEVTLGIQRCQRCGDEMALDVEASEYFIFLRGEG